ncbi:ATP-binding protein [Streptomyces sp. NBS 14/10]|uniref:ATP-binding protein n=1 Tax=Streptomyces sp. NBS 14/10 TaxID=1945643 RepID=UPI00211B6C08|nr:ATP-binding protein [Streptomyces sp. NBS 14/10]KAK1182937.1 ATP-binding protein [Streptomyces sp. NBS 14/10]
MKRQPSRRGGTAGQRPEAGAVAIESARGPALSRRLHGGELSRVAEVRAALRELLRHWGDPSRRDLAELLISELVTNALVHTDRGAHITATLGDRPDAPVGGRLRVEVRDFVSRHPTLRTHAAEEGTSGRGLLLVHTLADAWGVRAHGVGKAVWFELDARFGPPDTQ